MEAEKLASPFVALPLSFGAAVRILGPEPTAAAGVVDPLFCIDAPIAAARAVVGGLCDAQGDLVQPIEIWLLVDPSAVPQHRQIPARSVIRALLKLPNVLRQLSPIPGFELLREVFREPRPLAPLLYCRKRHLIFEAHSQETGAALRGVLPEHATGDGDAALPIELVVWDGPSRNSRQPRIYAASGGQTAVGTAASLEQMVLDQGGVAGLSDTLGKTDPVAAERLVDSAPCCRCIERDRCYPAGDSYGYAADRLSALSAASSPFIATPLGEWRWHEAAAIIGGGDPAEICGQAPDNGFGQWLRGRAARMRSFGPARLLSGESDGRELLEATRLKLALAADALAQLSEAWSATGQPHLCWNDETIRVAWREPGMTPGVCWGFQPIVRKIGLQPAAEVATFDGRSTPCPPAFSDANAFGPEALDASRYFDEPRSANLFVKADNKAIAAGRVVALAEGLNIPWDLFCAGDTVCVSGDDLKAALFSPCAERNPDDGEGLPFLANAGAAKTLAPGKTYERVEFRWYPRFGEAVDLCAIGHLLLEALLCHDERPPKDARAIFNDERRLLVQALRAAPLEQRESVAKQWVAERADADAPASLWTRRNVLYRKKDRDVAKLDALTPALWRAIVSYLLRLTTWVEGFSICRTRAENAPRSSDGALLPLLELRGLIALLDDQLFGRAAPGEQIRARVK